MRDGKLLSMLLALPLVFALSPANRVAAQEATSQGETHAQSQAAANVASEATATAEKPATGVKAGTKISAQLQSNVDTRTAKPGDEVKARVTKDVKQHGRVLIHKGDTLAGHVAEVKSSETSKAGSSMSVVFDQLISGGSTTQLNTAVSSFVSAQSASAAEENETAMPAPMISPQPAPSSGGARAGGGLLGTGGSTVSATTSAVGSLGQSVGAGVGSTVGSTVGAVSNTQLGSAGGPSLATPLSAVHVQSQSGVQHQTGMNSVFSTRHGDLRLDSGTQMQFQVVGQADAQSK